LSQQTPDFLGAAVSHPSTPVLQQHYPSFHAYNAKNKEEETDWTDLYPFGNVEVRLKTISSLQCWL